MYKYWIFGYIMYFIPKRRLNNRTQLKNPSVVIESIMMVFCIFGELILWNFASMKQSAQIPLP